MGKLPANGKTQPRAAIFSFRGAICLLEGLEDHFALAFRYPDPRILNGKAQHCWLSRCKAIFGRKPDIEADLSVFPGKFESVGKEISQYLLQPLSVRRQPLFRRLSCYVNLKMDAPVVCHFPKLREYLFLDTSNFYLADIQFHLPGLHFREIEDVINKAKQVDAAAANVFRMFHFLSPQHLVF